MKQNIIDLYDRFTHGQITRRQFLDRLTEIAGSAAAAAAIVPLLGNDYARAETVPADDPRLVGESASYDAAGTKMSGYLVRLKDTAKRPAVIVIHENRGLNPHIKDVARRIALEGFLAFGVDALAPYGGTPGTDDQARDLFAAKVKFNETAARFAAAIPFLTHHAASTGAVGVVGFCWGGGVVNELAVLSPDLKAGVAYYGVQPAAERVPSIRAALLLHYAGLDQRVNAGMKAYEDALKANNKQFSAYIYPNVNHGFNNDTSSRYDKAAADLAWGRTIAFLKEHLA